MDIIKVFEDPRIKMLEEEIARWNDHCRYTDEENHVVSHLLEQRSCVLHQLHVPRCDERH